MSKVFLLVVISQKLNAFFYNEEKEKIEFHVLNFIDLFDQAVNLN